MSDVFIQSEQRVSPVELFFDLVFGFAFTQVTTFWVEHNSWGGLGQGLLVLATLWWVWASFAWLTNTANTEADLVLAVVVVATTGVFVAALAVPGAFNGDRLLFGISILGVLTTFVGLYAEVSRGLPDQLAAVLRMSRTAVPSAGLILGAAFVPTGVRPVLWGLAIVVGLFGPNLGGLGGWRVFPAHFAERHGLILIIAIGESLSAVGYATRGTHLDGAEVGTAVLGLAVAAAFWLAYFDFASGGIRRLLEGSSGVQRIALARDAYTYMHLPMVVGILLFAFAMRTALVHPGADLETVPAVALCCSNAVYLLAFVGLRWRASGNLGIGRPIASAAFLLLTPAARVVPAVAGLALVGSVWAGLHVYELVHWREARRLRKSLEATS